MYPEILLIVSASASLHYRRQPELPWLRWQPRGEQLLPKFPADKIPVEKGVLEKESECEDELSPECGVVATDKNGEERHRKHGKDAKGVTELERLPEHFPLGNPLAKKG